MDELRKVAFTCIARAVGFGGLFIFCVMVGLAFDPVLSAKAGGILTMLMTLILLIKARGALYEDYKRTEFWVLLPKEFRPPEAYAQWASSTVLREAYLWFAQFSAAICVGLWVLVLVLSLFL